MTNSLKELIMNRVSTSDMEYDSELNLVDRYSELVVLISYLQEFDKAQQKSICNKIFETVRYAIAHCPNFVLGPYWSYAPLCQSIALIRANSALWKEFTDVEKKQLYQIMKMFAYNWNLGCNTQNNYGTGVDLRGNYGKWRGPNYRLANIGLIFPLVSFFGSIENLNSLFLSYDYASEMQKLKELSLNNAYDTWTKCKTFTTSEGKRVLGAEDLTTNGGTAYIRANCNGLVNTFWRGEGKGVKIPFEFKDSYPYGIIHFLYNNCFDGGPCLSSVKIADRDFTAHVADGTTTPFENEEGMMLEFNLANDGVTTRSSLFYCTIDFLLVMGLAITLEKLNISKLKDYRQFKKVWTGIEDYIYKEEHGYIGYKLGISEDFPCVFSVLPLYKEYWKNIYRPFLERNNV